MALFNKKELGKTVFKGFDFNTVKTDAITPEFLSIDKSYLNKLIVDDLANAKMADLDSKEPEPEEWIWVNGYKGTDKNMQCHDGFQYELGKRFDMPEDAEIKECSSGFHLCLNLSDVTRTYYPIGSGNRFFRVRALVRKNDALHYGKYTGWGHHSDKLVAKSIEFTSELSPDVILAGFGVDEWPDEYKKMAIEVSVKEAQNLMQTRELVELGYSEPFAGWICQNHKYAIAKIAASQPGLSMDMRAFMVMKM